MSSSEAEEATRASRGSSDCLGLTMIDIEIGGTGTHTRERLGRRRRGSGRGGDACGDAQHERASAARRLAERELAVDQVGELPAEMKSESGATLAPRRR